MASLGTPCEFAPLDVSSRDSVDAFARFMENDVGRCDGLVNNAGFAFKGSDPTPFEGQTAPTLKVNYWGATRLTDKLLPLLRRETNELPFVINVASMAGRCTEDLFMAAGLQPDPAAFPPSGLLDSTKVRAARLIHGITTSSGWTRSRAASCASSLRLLT